MEICKALFRLCCKSGCKTNSYCEAKVKSNYVVFSRDDATIEQIEAINWEHPDIMQRGERECPLPQGCAFKVQKISYFHIYRIYIVRIKKL